MFTRIDRCCDKTQAQSFFAQLLTMPSMVTDLRSISHLFKPFFIPSLNRLFNECSGGVGIGDAVVKAVSSNRFKDYLLYI